MNDYLIRDSLTGQVLSEAQAAELPPERVVREDLTRVRELKDEIERLTGALHSLRTAFEGGEALLAEARAAIERVRAMHPRSEMQDDDERWVTFCAKCQPDDRDGFWPCPTIAALDGIEEFSRE